MIAGLDDITDGEIRIGDRIVNNVEPRDRGVAMVGSPKMNLISAEVASDGTLTSPSLASPMNLPASVAGPAAGVPATLGIRPHDLALSANGPLVDQVRLVERLGN